MTLSPRIGAGVRSCVCVCVGGGGGRSQGTQFCRLKCQGWNSSLQRRALTSQPLSLTPTKPAFFMERLTLNRQ